MSDLRTLTVGELRKLLAIYPEDMPCAFAYPSGDHWRTMLMGRITGAEVAKALWSGYHDQHEVADHDDGTRDSREVLVLGMY